MKKTILFYALVISVLSFSAVANEEEIKVNKAGDVIMSKKIFNQLPMEDSQKGRKNYCCHNNNDRRCKVIRASNSISAAGKCMAHYAGRPVTSHKGNCDH